MLMDANEMANCGFGATTRSSVSGPRRSSFITGSLSGEGVQGVCVCVGGQ